VGIATRALVLIAVLAGAGTARAERRPNPLEEVVVLVLRQTEAGRWEAGAGAAGGWRPLADLHVRYHVSDTVTVGPRLRLDLEGGAPRALELEVGKAIGVGKMMLFRRQVMGARLVLSGGAGAVRFTDQYAGFAFAGVALRVYPTRTSWLAIELGVRQAWAPSPAPPAAAARSTTAALPDELVYGRATELRAALAVLWPRPRRECVARGPLRGF
jgi:hypothetical protein